MGGILREYLGCTRLRLTKPLPLYRSYYCTLTIIILAYYDGSFRFCTRYYFFPVLPGRQDSSRSINSASLLGYTSPDESAIEKWSFVTHAFGPSEMRARTAAERHNAAISAPLYPSVLFAMYRAKDCKFAPRKATP